MSVPPTAPAAAMPGSRLTAILVRSASASKARGTGSLSDLARAELRLKGGLETDDANSLLLASGFDRLLTAQKGPGRLMLSAEGLVGGDVRFDARLEAADLDARANGVARPLAGKGAGANFNLMVNKADAAPLRRLAAAPATRCR